MTARRARVLLAITVYNGRQFVPAAIDSATRIDASEHDVDVLVLDDHSPDPGWSTELAELCALRGVRYYRSPRNLGIPRNVNLGLLAAVEGGYSHALIANSDVVFPSNLIRVLVACADTDAQIGSVTAMSNNVSVYSLPFDPPGLDLGDQQTIDRVSSSLEQRFGTTVVDVPTGVSFCMLFPTPAISAIGLMDPAFGRGYCEENDWSLRSTALGYRCVLAPGVFAFHAGRGSNEAAGLVGRGETSVPINETIIDLRYPEYRRQVAAWLASGVLHQLHTEALRALDGMTAPDRAAG